VTGDPLFRIGELSRRSGVSPELLRAWERRYGLLQPVRSPGGLRLYSLDDYERVRLMREHLAEGFAAAEAAAAAAGANLGEESSAVLEPAVARTDLAAALEQFDEPAAQGVLDRLLAAVTLDTLLSDVLLPYLHDLGDRWERGEASVAQEHFASNLLRGRLLGLARGWGRGSGRLVLLACPPGEQHDIGLIAFGLAMRARGWRIGYLGSDTPIESLVDATRSLDPSLLVISAVAEKRFQPAMSELKAISQRHRIGLAGAGAGRVEAAAIGAITLPGDLVAEAERVTEMVLSGNT
jgi:MerR family transcriptional regulator, light-induced transcriptional regulator